MLDIKQILGEEYLKRFKIFYEQTLFPPIWENIRVGRCPLCSNKLKIDLKGNGYCPSNKHGKAFFITRDKLNKIK